ncbi:MAG: DNA primase [Parcubacteria group bacterium Gr01-1014_3]|nr:MAG: DNA primase [Parcubacteria group bacterium Gr01-1014_3]
MSDTVQQIKEKLDLAVFLKPYLQLVPAGKNFKARCPFHQEKSASFIVSPEKQVWHCFGCNTGGDILSFVMKYENIEFLEALKILAEKAGVDLQRFGNSDQKKFNILYDINQAAVKFFQEALRHAQGKQVMDYLIQRGLKPETISDFEIGFAPDSFDALLQYLIKSRFSTADIERAGLIFKSQRGNYIDRFRNRVMFPLRNAFGKVVGFTGRILPGAAPQGGASLAQDGRETPKYVNSPETQIFNKSKILFGFDKTKSAIRDSKSAVLVEGQMDLIMAWQDGIQNIIATSGTALTVDHLKAIRRIADNLIVAFDQDEAGQAATEKAIDMADAMDFSTKVMMLKPELANQNLKDPADIAKAHPGALAVMLQESQPSMIYYFSRYLSKPKIAKQDLRAVLVKIKNIYSPVEKSKWLKELANKTKVDEKSLIEEMEVLQDSGPSGVAEENNSPQAQSLPRKDLLSQRIISLVVARKDLFSAKGGSASGGKIEEVSSTLTPAYQKVLSYLNGEVGVELPAQHKTVADLLSLRVSVDASTDEEKIRDEAKELLRQLQLENYKDQRLILKSAIEQAENAGDEIKLAVALSEFDKISKQIQTLNNQAKT